MPPGLTSRVQSEYVIPLWVNSDAQRRPSAPRWSARRAREPWPTAARKVCGPSTVRRCVRRRGVAARICSSIRLTAERPKNCVVAFEPSNEKPEASKIVARESCISESLGKVSSELWLRSRITAVTPCQRTSGGGAALDPQIQAKYKLRWARKILKPRRHRRSTPVAAKLRAEEVAAPQGQRSWKSFSSPAAAFVSCCTAAIAW